MKPINQDGSSVFKGGSAVQVKFRLTDASGNYAVNAKPLIRLWIMEMYRSPDNRLLGTYASHHMELAGWRSDSSRLYVRRAGSRWLNLSGPMKAVMVPPKEYESSKY